MACGTRSHTIETLKIAAFTGNAEKFSFLSNPFSFSFDIASGQSSETYRIKVTMPERREFFFIDFE